MTQGPVGSTGSPGPAGPPGPAGRPSNGRIYPSQLWASHAWNTTSAAPSEEQPSIFQVGDYVWHEDARFRFFIRGVVISAKDAANVVIHLEGPFRNCRRHAMIVGGRLRVRDRNIVRPEVLERLAFDAAASVRKPGVGLPLSSLKWQYRKCEIA